MREGASDLMEQEPRERGKGAEAGMLPGVLLCYPKAFSLFQELTNVNTGAGPTWTGVLILSQSSCVTWTHLPELQFPHLQK